MTNIGSADRTIRLVVGVILIVAPFVPPVAETLMGWGVWRYAIAAAGAVMVGTAMFRFCPAYALLGIRTCPAAKRHGARR